MVEGRWPPRAAGGYRRSRGARGSPAVASRSHGVAVRRPFTSSMTPQESVPARSTSVTGVTFASGRGPRSDRTEGPFWTIIRAMGPPTSRGHAATLLLWAFYLGAQLGSEPPERGLVATATQAACEAARTGVAELARASGTTVEIGDCRELSPDDIRRHRSHGVRSGTASPPGQDRGSRGAARGAPAARPPSNVRCLSRDSCAEQF